MRVLSCSSSLLVVEMREFLGSFISRVVLLGLQTGGLFLFLLRLVLCL